MYLKKEGETYMKKKVIFAAAAVLILMAGGFLCWYLRSEGILQAVF